MGSEMCIRDRPRTHPRTAAGAVPAHRRRRLEEPLLSEALERRGPCLLYSSDAADDLLCVDLGGRRIIKKKKHKRRQTIDSKIPNDKLMCSQMC